MDLVTTLLAATTTSAGAGVLVTRGRRKRAHRRAVARRVAASDVALPLETSHLSPALAGVTVGARVVRLSLQTPLRRMQDVSGHEASWRLRERLSEYDLALADARLALYQWLGSLGRLQTEELGVLRTLALDPRPLRSIMYKPGVFDRSEDAFDEALFPVMPDPELVVRELGDAMDHLRRFEVGLLGYRGDPYR